MIWETQQRRLGLGMLRNHRTTGIQRRIDLEPILSLPHIRRRQLEDVQTRERATTVGLPTTRSETALSGDVLHHRKHKEELAHGEALENHKEETAARGEIPLVSQY